MAADKTCGNTIGGFLESEWVKRHAGLLCFGIFTVLFALGAIGTEITRIDIRFALMVQDMTLHGLGLFPTVNAVEYGDYPSGWVLCSWLTTFGGRHVSLWLLTLPAILLGAYTMMMTYLTGEQFGRHIGLAAVLFLAITPEFLKLLTGFGIDVPVMAAGVTMLYLFRRGCSAAVAAGVFAGLLIVCFLFRGPMGIVLLGAGTGGYLLAERAWLRVLLLGVVGAVITALCGIFWYLAVHAQGGADLWEWFMQCQLLSRMGESEYGTYFVDGMFSFAPVTLLALGVFLLPRKLIFSRPVAGWLGYVLLPMVILSIPACKHLRYLAIAMPGFALLAAYAWIGHLRQPFIVRWRNRVLAWCRILAYPLALAGIVALAVTGCFLTEPVLLPWWHFAGAAILISVCRFWKYEGFRNIRPAAIAALFLILALNPFLSSMENSEHFVNQVESARTGQVYLYEMGPDHEDLKYVLWTSPEKRGQIRYLYSKIRLPKPYPARMYPSGNLSEHIQDIAENDVLILRERKKELTTLQAEAQKYGRTVEIVHAGSLGHREFVAVRLVREK